MMAVKTRLPLFIPLLSLSAIFSVAVLAKEDPALKNQCECRCNDYVREKQARELSERRGRRVGFNEDEAAWNIDNYYRLRLKGCLEQCKARFGRRREEEYQGWGEEEEKFSREECGVRSSPYVFEKNEFVTKVNTEHGRVGILPRFRERSKLLQGIDDFRLGFLDIDPHAFLVPHYFDADSLLFVVEGRGTITVLKEDKKDHISFEEGHVVRIREGSPVYFVNMDSNERLRIAILLKAINVPGHVELYHGTRGGDRKSFYSAFSLDVLEAALKTDRQSLEELFGHQQQKPAIVLASNEQIEALSRGGSSNSSHAFNIFNKEPSKSNQFGQLREVDTNDFIGLMGLDVRVTFVNIAQGAMIGPYFNSRTTVISVVTKGKGHLEMACSHSEQHERQAYGTMWSSVQQGTVFIVPEGHPVVVLASENDTLQILFYEVNAENNIRYPLAGKNNIVSLMDQEAKELAFDLPSREVDGVFGNQEEELFFSGPRHRQQKHRGCWDRSGGFDWVSFRSLIKSDSRA